MKVSAVSNFNYQPKLRQTGSLKQQAPANEPQGDTVSFKGWKNGLRGGGIGLLAGAFVGALCMPALGILAGAATLGSIVGGVGAVRGLMEDDKNNMLKG